MRLTALAMIAVLRGSQGLTRTVLRAAASTGATQKRVLVPIADGSEEIETCCITDTLVRAGAEVTVASVEATTTCTMSRGLKIVADALVTDVSGDWDLVALPGGMPGAERLRDSDALDAILRKQDARGMFAGSLGGGALRRWRRGRPARRHRPDVPDDVRERRPRRGVVRPGPAHDGGEVLGHRRRHRRARVLEHDLEANLERLVARPGHASVEQFPEHHGVRVDVALLREHVILEELGSHERRCP